MQPPKIGQVFPVLVPAIDADGNERDGVRLPEISVPLASYLSWNLRDPSIGAPTERVPFEVSFVPFPRTEAERIRARDPRRSIADRYEDRDDYIVRFTNALDKLIQQRYILLEDRTPMLERGEQEWDLATAR